MAMLLIDVGNTRIKWALAAAGAAPGVWLQSGSAALSELSMLSERWRKQSVARILISNVAGEHMQERLQTMLEIVFGAALRPNWFVSPPRLAGLRNGYRDPAQLGCDRFAAALGAQQLFPQETLLVATCGTATTIDAVTADGVFSGGMILPGLGLMATSLARSTAKLPHITDHVQVDTQFADNTDGAIISGCINAQVGAIERGFALLGQQAAGAAVRCIVAGGSAALIAPYLSIRHETVDNLVLIGLQTAAATI
ncbi:type III pantothenate kinase [Collimonas sp. PA-H2]|uniref:type III pantothenate kinase n=1 Tax=Collimonas sp. PA-H2 TaxID=1881062 RepID=UPI000BF4DFF9|nr:type III pantothenate kinase [Collimonas sp. PA-H2]PFH09493.1 type III pantothenate kinase [Collimonas sp. PA-H2]